MFAFICDNFLLCVLAFILAVVLGATYFALGKHDQEKYFQNMETLDE